MSSTVLVERGATAVTKLGECGSRIRLEAIEKWAIGALISTSELVRNGIVRPILGSLLFGLASTYTTHAVPRIIGARTLQVLNTRLILVGIFL
jgi:hypothetical protein